MRIQPVAIVLVVLAVVFFVVGILYLTQTANHLPSFMPGHTSPKLPECSAGKTTRPCFTPRHYTKRGIAAIGLGVILLVGAWYTSGLRKRSRVDSSSD
jgi:hypothetical protein